MNKIPENLNEIELDVSELEAPQPLILILEKLNDLKSHDILRIKHRKDPLGLYPYLNQDLYQYEKIIEEGYFYLYVWRIKV